MWALASGDRVIGGRGGGAGRGGRRGKRRARPEVAGEAGGGERAADGKVWLQWSKHGECYRRDGAGVVRAIGEERRTGRRVLDGRRVSVSGEEKIAVEEECCIFHGFGVEKFRGMAFIGAR